MKKTNILKAILGGVGAVAGIGALVSAFAKDKPEEEATPEDETDEVSDEE